MEKEILELLETNSKLSYSDISNMTGYSQEEIEKKIEDFESKRIICGYPTLINWDKSEMASDYIKSIIEVKVAPQKEQGFDTIAKKIYSFDEVKALYLMSGTFDFLIIVKGKNIKDISYFVSSKLATLDCILSTSTHFVLKKYKDHSLVLDENKKFDERIIISP